jgi:hypothetical protein
MMPEPVRTIALTASIDQDTLAAALQYGARGVNPEGIDDRAAVQEHPHRDGGRVLGRARGRRPPDRAACGA